MKRTILFTFVAMLAMSISSIAQTWQKFNYQGVARDAQGEVLEDQAVGVRISLHEATAGGTVVYRETHSVTTNEFGLFDLAIGGGTPVIGDFSLIDWGSNDYFVEVELDPAGGTAYTSMGTTQLLSVPYAMYAANAATTESVADGTEGQTLTHDGTSWVASSDLMNLGGNVGIGATVPSAKLHIRASGSDMARFEGVGTSNWISLYQGSIRKGILWNAGDDMVLRSDATTGRLRFQTAGNNNRMVIDSDGLVGVGIDAPNEQSRLHVVENTLQAGLLVGAANGLLSYLTINKPTSAGSTGIVRFREDGTTVLVVSEQSQPYQLTVYGDAFASGGTWTASDKSLKREVSTISSAMENLMRLEPVSYFFDNTSDAADILNLPEELQFGLLAQDVQEVFPNLVRETNITDEDGNVVKSDLHGLNYTGLIPVLIKGLQEQQQRIEQMQAEIDRLKNK